jgi:hypothetical protein
VTLFRTNLDELPEVSTWASSWNPPLSAGDFLSQRVSVAKALAVMRLFWPEFVEVRGCVLLSSQYTASGFQTWWETLDGDRERIERVMNHVHLWDVFGPTLADDASTSTEEAALEELGQLMRRTVTAALLDAFPRRKSEVVYSTDPDDYGPTVTFWTKAVES